VFRLAQQGGGADVDRSGFIPDKHLDGKHRRLPKPVRVLQNAALMHQSLVLTSAELRGVDLICLEAEQVQALLSLPGASREIRELATDVAKLPDKVRDLLPEIIRFRVPVHNVPLLGWLQDR
jgi:hypothetical protein